MGMGKFVAGLFLSCAVCACSTWNKLDNKEKGAVIGGGTGAVVGNSVSPGLGGTVIGGAVGALGGGAVGHEMDRDDRRRRY